MKNKLYIVEGLPCSGKSTIGRYVAELIQGKYVDEGTGNHPADYEFQSFISYESITGKTGKRIEDFRKIVA